VDGARRLREVHRRLAGGVAGADDDDIAAAARPGLDLRGRVVDAGTRERGLLGETEVAGSAPRWRPPPRGRLEPRRSRGRHGTPHRRPRA
jgi:hypothetical protein